MDGRASADGWPHTLIAVSLLLTIVLIAENVFPSLNRKHKDTKTRNKRNGSDNKSHNYVGGAMTPHDGISDCRQL